MSDPQTTDPEDQKMVNSLAEKLVTEEDELAALPVSDLTQRRRVFLASDVLRLRHMLNVFEEKMDLKPELSKNDLRFKNRLFKKSQ
jgi:hypothetical protein